MKVSCYCCNDKFTLYACSSGCKMRFQNLNTFFMALAATSISGTKISLFLNFSPTTAMASIIPLFKISCGSQPSSRASCTAFPTSSLYRFLLILQLLRFLTLFYSKYYVYSLFATDRLIIFRTHLSFYRIFYGIRLQSPPQALQTEGILIIFLQVQ